MPAPSSCRRRRAESRAPCSSSTPASTCSASEAMADGRARTKPTNLPGAVVFDVGNVLLSWDPHSILRDHLPAGADHEQFLRAVFTHPHCVELDRGTPDEGDALLRFAARTGAAPELVRRLVHASKTSLTPMPESLALLEELRRTGATKLYVLSNMSHATWEYLEPRHD